ncbi:MAG: PCP reductase family protein [Vicinamibacterales bacterium]
MKFLCVPCDSPMTLQTVGPPEGGSLSVVYACPECGYEMAMLTNPFETQLVQSLGVRIGPALGAEPSSTAGASLQEPVGRGLRPAQAGAVGNGDAVAAGPAGKCPFAAMVTAGDGAISATGPPPPALDPHVRWTPGAEARLANIPEFVRPMARTGIESYARERGVSEVDETVLDAARGFFGM